MSEYVNVLIRRTIKLENGYLFPGNEVVMQREEALEQAKRGRLLIVDFLDLYKDEK